jgi:hypothetical protein
MMDERGKSDSPVVPGKPPNKAEEPAAEAAEGRGLAKGNSGERDALRTPGRAGALSALDEYVRQPNGTGSSGSRRSCTTCTTSSSSAPRITR